MNEITMRGQVTMDPMSVAQVFKASNMFPDIQSEAAACAKIIIGRGLGLTDYDAMAGLHIIKGKVVLAANLMAAAIKRSGKYDYRATCTDSECTISFLGHVDGRFEKIGETTFTMDDAKRAGISGGQNWRNFPAAMLFARCVSSGYRQHCPDALGSAPVYVEAHGEMEIVDDSNAPITPVQTIRKVAEAPSKKMSAKQSFIAAVSEWVGCSQGEAVKHAMRILHSLSLPTDGTVTDDKVKWAEVWVRTRIEEGQDISVLDAPAPKKEIADAPKSKRGKALAPVQPVLVDTQSEEEELEF